MEPELSIITSARARLESKDSCAASRAAKSPSVHPRCKARANRTSRGTSIKAKQSHSLSHPASRINAASSTARGETAVSGPPPGPPAAGRSPDGSTLQGISVLSARRGRGKDDFCQPRAVNMTIRAEDRVAPALAGRFFDARQPQGLMARTIGIEHHGAQFRQLPGDQALAACHAAEETEDFHIQMGP